MIGKIIQTIGYFSSRAIRSLKPAVKPVVIVDEHKYNLENTVSNSEQKEVAPEFINKQVGSFDVPLNGVIENSYMGIRKVAKKEGANVAVIEKRNDNSLVGTLYSHRGNTLSSENFKGTTSFNYSSGKYVLVN